MKAAQINDYGDPSVIQVVDTDTPQAQAGQVLVEVHATSLNPFDTTIRTGAMKDAIPLQFPVTLGGDIAGTIVELGEGVEGFSIGDKVYGQANVVAGNSGAFAECAATAVGQIARAPENLDMSQTASLPLVGVSALQALTEHINLQTGQKILIHGGAGGIGSIAIQIAKHMGAYVATTATGQGIEIVKGLGADEVIDFKSQDFADELSGFDAVFDTVGRDDFTKALKVLNRGGVAVSMIAQADEKAAEELGVNAFTQQTRATTERLNELCALVETGVVVPQVGKVFSLDQIQEAFTARESGSVQGKVVIQIKPQ